jgi:hypothetical protein
LVDFLAPFLAGFFSAIANYPRASKEPELLELRCDRRTAHGRSWMRIRFQRDPQEDAGVGAAAERRDGADLLNQFSGR